MDNTIKSNAINRGMILGGVLSLMTVISYAVYPDLFTNWGFLIFLFVFVIAYGIVSAIRSKKILGGFISFKDAFTSYFITLAIGTAISTVVSIIIYTVVDPEAAIAIKEKSIEMAVSMMEKFNAPKEAVEQAIAKMEEENPLSVGSQIFNWFKGMIFYIIIGLIAALAIKKKQPEF